jgi:hypothetical protein
MEENIFSLLFKWGDSKSKSEDYYSKSLTFILSHLLNSAGDHYRRLAVDIMNRTFAKRLGFSFKFSNDISIEAHRKTKGGKIPDITIKAKNKLIYVEIKVDSPINGDALKRIKIYRERLSGQKDARNNGLILITKSGNEPVDSIPLEQISWFTLSGELRYALNELKRNGITDSATIYYLLDKFYEFLKERDMAILKVEDNFDPTTIHNVTKLLSMLELVCKDKELRFSRKPWLAVESSTQAGESCLGYWNKKDGNYAICIYPETPVKCYFEIHEHDKIQRLFAGKSEEEANTELQKELHKDAALWREDSAIGVKLDLSSRGFFGQDVREADQVKIIKDFIKEIEDKWNQFKIKKMGRKRGR